MEVNISSKASNNYVLYATECIDKFIKENGRLPHKQEVSSEIAIDYLIQLFGSWKNSLKQLGFKETFASIEDLKNLRDSLGVIPSIKVIKEKGININDLIKQYGSWENVKTELKDGFVRTKPKVSRKNSLSESEILELKEVLSEDLVNLTKTTGAIPTLKQLKERHYKISKINICFGSWKKAVSELNLQDVMKDFIASELKIVQNNTTEKIKPDILEDSGLKLYSVKKLYGSWSKAYNEIGLINNRKIAIQNEIVALTNDLEKVPTLKEIENNKIPIKCLNVISNWSELKEEWNLKEIANKYIIEQIKKLSDILDKTPTLTQIKEHGIKYSKLISNGTKWKDVRESIGLPKHSKYTNSYIKEIETNLLDLAESMGKTPTFNIAKENGIKVHILSKRYDGWNNVLFKLGLKQIKNYTDEALSEACDSIIVLSEKLGRSPYIRELKEYNIPVNPLVRKYGSMGECYKAIGLRPNHETERTYEKEEVLKSIKELTIKTGKTPSRKAVKENEINVSPLIREIGSWAKVKELIMETNKTEIIAELEQPVEATVTA